MNGIGTSHSGERDRGTALGRDAHVLDKAWSAGMGPVGLGAAIGRAGKDRVVLGCLVLSLVALMAGLLGHGAQARLVADALQLEDAGVVSLRHLHAAQDGLLNTIAMGRAATPDWRRGLEEIADDIGAVRSLSPAGARAMGLLLAKLREVAALHEADQPAAATMAVLIDEVMQATGIALGDVASTRRKAVHATAAGTRWFWSGMALSLLLAMVAAARMRRARAGVAPVAAAPLVRAMPPVVAWEARAQPFAMPPQRASVAASCHMAAPAVSASAPDTGLVVQDPVCSEAVAIQSSAGWPDMVEPAAALPSDVIEPSPVDPTVIEPTPFEPVTLAAAFPDPAAAQQEWSAAALDNMPHGLCMFDAGGRLRLANRRFRELFGHPPPGAADHNVLPGPLLGSKPGEPIRQLPDGRAFAVAWQLMDGGGWVATFEDVTDRMRTEARLAHMARHDTMTGLPNRTMYREHMEQALAQTRRGGALAVLCIGLHGFKTANSTLGHEVGDVLLRKASRRVTEVTRESDLVVRLGGVAFAAVQRGAKQPRDAKRLAERFVAALSRPFDVAGHTITLGVSIGIAVTKDGVTTGDDMLKSADLALERARADGNGTFRFFDAEMDAKMQARHVIERDLRRAIAAQEFVVFYQPLVDTRSGMIDGFEALVRWQHPERGIIPPDEFIPIAEDVGLIGLLGGLVLEHACADAMTWPDAVNVAVNLSPLQFASPGLVQGVKAALDASGLRPGRLELEITESLLLQDSDATLAALQELRAMGVHISMDDFGTGYSSLSYLRRFPFDKIKIDQSFIRSLGDGADCLVIVRAMVGLGASLGMRVTAEGVETEEQLDLLRREGCHQVQGYLFSRPLPLHLVGRLLEGVVEVV